jgi:hypothetical protein
VVVSSGARLRDREVLHEQIEALTRHLGQTRADFPRGARDALRWVLEGGPGPLTGCVEGLPVPVPAIVRELASAEAVIYGPRSHHREYCQGVEHALMWAQFATAAPPLPSPRPSGNPSAIHGR